MKPSAGDLNGEEDDGEVEIVCFELDQVYGNSSV